MFNFVCNYAMKTGVLSIGKDNFFCELFEKNDKPIKSV
ncbi:hypothetical protein B4110_2465 [Parageobacillus toebii]|uniref:Uncharacterized protein n=1 Tax=Parageobacillus toebii TaxID=153151 RepID=A0A150MSV9_9BACL|nr:hypothetical protein B4110_2465 [Parageobacillus toebii]